MKKDIKYKIYELGNKLGLNKDDLDFVLKDFNAVSGQVSLSIGPPWYPGGRYGTISIKDF